MINPLNNPVWLFITAPACYVVGWFLSTHTEINLIASSSELGFRQVIRLSDSTVSIAELLLEVREFVLWLLALCLLSFVFKSSHYAGRNLVFFVLCLAALLLGSLTEFKVEKEVVHDEKEHWTLALSLYWIFGVLPFLFSTVLSPRALSSPPPATKKGKKTDFPSSAEVKLVRDKLLPQRQSSYKQQKPPDINTSSPSPSSPSPSSSVLSPTKINPIQKKKYRASVFVASSDVLSQIGSLPPLEGYLLKRSKASTFSSGSWQKRFFKCQGAYLLYYAEAPVGADDSKNNPVCAALDLRFVSAVSHEYIRSQASSFSITFTDGTKYWLAPYTSEDMQEGTNKIAEIWCSGLTKRRDVLIAGLRKEAIAPETPLGSSNSGGGGGGDDDDDNGRERALTTTISRRHVVSEDELVGVGEMKALFPKVDSAMLLRFYRARKGNVPAAEQMLKKHLKWRKDKFPITWASVEDQIKKGKFQ